MNELILGPRKGLKRHCNQCLCPLIRIISDENWMNVDRFG
jgi:hypothetical protein